ncbi:MAG: pantoate--beta-alanine ligase [Actinobacteria bacterium]|uniref:pantoate--beta-alanine ligase (AMP-forming) n=1 Tax=freshwater metagenome TaxID=449393 RepID=A0A6J6NT27_9ZZZZ|nr:pantoate--beta-alanine ligase [Actinomycetota bacterium]
MIEVIKSVDDLARQKWDVLVPTMGALHVGHQSLIKIAKTKGEKVLVSIFVNPLQFENNEDLVNYPKTLEQDINIAEAAGATAIFVPNEQTIYPGKIEKISAGEIGNIFEGASRPEHFTGVLTVVKRLFDLVKPKAAVFGEKDFQQLFLINQMVGKLKLPIEIISVPTIREKNGLAISSRNIRLDKNGEKIAEVIYRALSQPTIEQMRSEISKEPGFKLDYLEVIDETTFEMAKPDTKNKRAIIAGWVNQLRLIDNIPMGMRQ